MTDLAIHWDSTQLFPRQTTSYGSRILVYPMDFGDASLTRSLQPVAFGQGTLEKGYYAEKPRRGKFVLYCRCGNEQNAFLEYRTIKNLTSPFRDTATLRRVFKTGPSTTIDEKLEVRRINFPDWGWGGDARSLFVGPQSAGVIKIPIEWEAAYPYWLPTGSPNTQNVSISTTPQSVIIANGGDVPRGLAFSLASLSGTWTSILVENLTAGPAGESGGSITWTKSGGFANGNNFDWKHTYEWRVTQTSGTVLQPLSSIVLWLGNNTIRVTGTGGTSGTGTVSWFDGHE